MEFLYSGVHLCTKRLTRLSTISLRLSSLCRPHTGLHASGQINVYLKKINILIFTYYYQSYLINVNSEIKIFFIFQRRHRVFNLSLPAISVSCRSNQDRYQVHKCSTASCKEGKGGKGCVFSRKIIPPLFLNICYSPEVIYRRKSMKFWV